MAELSSLEPIHNRYTNGRRRAHHKVRTGCKACKSRRRKCDEQKPVCSGCTRHGTDCLYSPHDESPSNSSGVTKSSPSSTSTTRATELITTRKNGPVPPPQHLNLEDLELLHQWLTSTCITTSQLPEVTVQMQRTVPQLAQEHPFFMRGLLAQAAVHLSWLRPAKQKYYNLLAARHHGQALPEFRSSLQKIGEHNYSALIAYSFSLVWCAFARHAMWSTDVPMQQTLENVAWLPEWFSLLRGSCLLVESCRVWMSNGSHALPQIDDSLGFLESLDNRRMTELRARLADLSTSPVCKSVLSSLHHSFALAFMRHHNTPLRTAVNYWVGRLPNEYLKTLRIGEPWALVIMAHFCILVHRSEVRWFMKGHGARLLQEIVEQLGGSWEQYIQWPCEEVGIRPAPFVSP